MIKLLNLYFPGRLFLMIATEMVLILTGLMLAVLAYERSVTRSLEVFPSLTLHAILVTAVCQLCLYYSDLYDLRFFSSWSDILRRLMQAVGAAAIILALVLLLYPPARVRAGLFELCLAASVLLLFTSRVVIENLNRVYIAGQRMVLVGYGDAGLSLAREIRTRSDVPIQILGAIAEQEGGAQTDFMGLECLGHMGELTAVVERERSNLLVVALKERRKRLPVEELLQLRAKGVVIQDANTLIEHLTGRIPVESLHPSQLIFADGFRRARSKEWFARTTGFIAGCVGMLITLPIMALVALAVRLESKGPMLYSQERVGKDGRLFYLYKFRSMRADAEAKSGPVWASKEDPRVTRVGKIIRKLRLDELPQFFNVIRGDMSFVGPRPERLHFVRMLSEKIPYYDLRHTVRPGLTGWAQVRGSYGASVDESKEKLEYDLFYIKNSSVSLDMLILFSTAKTMIFGRGAR